jgi:hypothetical protein
MSNMRTFDDLILEGVVPFTEEEKAIIRENVRNSGTENADEIIAMLGAEE